MLASRTESKTTTTDYRSSLCGKTRVIFIDGPARQTEYLTVPVLAGLEQALSMASMATRRDERKTGRKETPSHQHQTRENRKV